MYLPAPDQSDILDGPLLSERSSPTPDTGDFTDSVDLTQSVSLSEEYAADAASDLKKRRRMQVKENERARLLEPTLVRALVSVAENQEDSFQRVCLETLAELCT